MSTNPSPPTWRVWEGDCKAWLPLLPPSSVDCVVTDPPAAISFMGREWDGDKGGRSQWIAWMTDVMREVYRVLKPGAHGFVWALPRTSHWTGMALEDAGFEVRDRVAHVFAQGFPKSKNLTGDWDGWGTALKPAVEDWWLIRKPLALATVQAQMDATETGALNIDGCRVPGRERTEYGLTNATRTQGAVFGTPSASADFDASAGRWPANLVLGPAAAAALDAMSGERAPGRRGMGKGDAANAYGDGLNSPRSEPMYTDTGGASRFFHRFDYSEEWDGPAMIYCAKADRADRDSGGAVRNTHVTVKPTDLCRHLVRLCCAPGGAVLDPFCGSGSIGVGALLEGMTYIGIEQSAEFVAIAQARLRRASLQPRFDFEGEGAAA